MYSSSKLIVPLKRQKAFAENYKTSNIVHIIYKQKEKGVKGVTQHCEYV